MNKLPSTSNEWTSSPIFMVKAPRCYNYVFIFFFWMFLILIDVTFFSFLQDACNKITSLGEYIVIWSVLTCGRLWNYWVWLLHPLGVKIGVKIANGRWKIFMWISQWDDVWYLSIMRLHSLHASKKKNVVCRHFSKLMFSKNFFRNTIRVSYSLGLGKARKNVMPDLGPKCLQRF